MIIKKYILVIILILSFFLASDRKEHLMNFSFYNFDSSDIKLQNSAGIAKPMLSSLIIPGLGQYQTGNKKKAALFFGVEVLARYLNNIYNKEADKKVSEYQDFSEGHWSFENWIINYDCWNPAYQGINNDCDYSFSNLFSNIEIDDNGNQVEDYLSIWEHSHHINFYYDNNLISTNDEAFQDLYFEFTTWNPDVHQGQSFMEFYNIEVDKDVLIRRLVERAKNSGRADDTEEVIKNRQNVYLELTAPLIEFYHGNIINIDGDGSIDKVTERILKRIP